MKTFLFLVWLLFSLKSYEQVLLPDSSLIRALSPSGLKNAKKTFQNFYGRALDGKLYTLDSIRGKVSFINFWFEQCAPCIAEFGALNDLYNKYKGNKDFQLLAFTFEDSNVVNRVAKKYKLEFTIISLNKDVLYGLMYNLGFPTNMLVDKSSQILLIKSGGAISTDKAKDDLNALFETQLENLLIQ